jgi:hypothetical protein
LPVPTPRGGIGGPTGQKIETRASIIALWEEARRAIEAAGGEVVMVDFPAVSNYEGDRPGCPTIRTRGLVSADYLHREIVDLSVWSWDNFLRSNGDPALNSLSQVDGKRIAPPPPGALPDRYTGFGDDIADYPAHALAHPVTDFREIPHLEAGFRGLEATRRIDLEEWMDRRGLDAVVFPAVADVGPADADVNPVSADLAWRNGTWVANGNLAIRHLGIPTVTVPMGVMADISMPAGLTFAGKAWDDSNLLQLAMAFEATGTYRKAPPRTPELVLATDLAERLQHVVKACAGPASQRADILGHVGRKAGIRLLRHLVQSPAHHHRQSQPARLHRDQNRPGITQRHAIVGADCNRVRPALDRALDQCLGGRSPRPHRSARPPSTSNACSTRYLPCSCTSVVPMQIRTALASRSFPRTQLSALWSSSRAHTAATSGTRPRASASPGPNSASIRFGPIRRIASKIAAGSSIGTPRSPRPSKVAAANRLPPSTSLSAIASTFCQSKTAS